MYNDTTNTHQRLAIDLAHSKHIVIATIATSEINQTPDSSLKFGETEISAHDITVIPLNDDHAFRNTSIPKQSTLS